MHHVYMCMCMCVLCVHCIYCVFVYAHMVYVHIAVFLGLMYVCDSVVYMHTVYLRVFVVYVCDECGEYCVCCIFVCV